MITYLCFYLITRLHNPVSLCSACIIWESYSLLEFHVSQAVSYCMHLYMNVQITREHLSQLRVKCNIPVVHYQLQPCKSSCFGDLSRHCLRLGAFIWQSKPSKLCSLVYVSSWMPFWLLVMGLIFSALISIQILGADWMKHYTCIIFLSFWTTIRCRFVTSFALMLTSWSSSASII